MKTTMKTLGTAFMILAISAGMLCTGCKKSDSSTANTSTVSADDAADAITTSTQASSNGVAEEATSVSSYCAVKDVYTTASTLPCGTAFDTTFVRSGNITAGTYDYSVNWQYLLTCGGSSTPSSLAFTYSMHGAYDFEIMSSNDSATGSWTVTGLAPSSANATINGTYIRNGSQQSKVRNLSSFTSIITYTLNNVTVNKTTGYINGGSAAVTISGTGIKGGTFSYSGSIAFSNSDTAVLTINGNNYTITLY